ncbi:NAD(P)/FAD-dependent oxidoreductase [Parendozoicomonas haliclonae]|uniref:Rubredoxin-NAD(+) reductase n=1 Tax=Parendozoicomonas haliclonae TaxID=1960125 RepID=A0A1X7AEG8_9GAMM|nr:FAD-dependent oxidoreductase [Parendozoicomonas haliclonae]SMA32759.1 Rubredoxin-NAD(+) reductase [Parendozoicomonas haliclonae]
MDSVVILGTGLAGYTLAREFRKLDKETPLVLITADDGRNYSKPMLSTGFAKGKDADGLAMQTPEQMAEQLNARILTKTQVASIDRSEKVVRLEDGSTESYGKLVLALGAEPVKPSLSGDAVDRVLSVNDLEDYHAFRSCLPEGGRVAILGAGLIGCEFANDLVAGGYQVEVVGASKHVMPGLLPSSAASAVQEALTLLGVSFHLNSVGTSVNQGANGLEVGLAGGDSSSAVQADVVLSAIGLRPRIALAKDAGLATETGICVNRTLATSDPDIYALGDCAEVEGLVQLYVMPLMACARSLAKTLAGEANEVSYGAMPVTVKTPACPVVVAPPLENGGQWQTEEVEGGLRITCTRENDLLGYVLTGTATSERISLNKRLPAIMP